MEIFKSSKLRESCLSILNSKPSTWKLNDNENLIGSQKFKHVFIVPKKFTLKNYSTEEFGIVDPLDDPLFGQLHRLFSLSLSIFEFFKFGDLELHHRIIGDLLTTPLYWPFDFFLQGLVHWNIRRDHVHSATRPMV